MKTMESKLSKLVITLKQVQLRNNHVDPVITGISHDSRTVKSGDLFICISGTKIDGRQFAKAAVDAGAAALLVEKYIDELRDIPQYIVPDCRKAEAIISAAFYDFPARKMTLTGVTGTNGKTTFTYLMESVLAQTGHHPGVIGTINYRYAGKTLDAPNTTPSSLELNALMYDMLSHGCDHLVMEVSSHSLVQGRVEGIDFDYGVFTNLTRDHLDFHGNMEDYLAAKSNLFKKLGIDFNKGFPKKSIINLDDPYADSLILSSPVPVISYGITKPADVKADHIELAANGVSFEIHVARNSYPVKLQLSGLFNVYNSLAAFATAYSMGLNPAEIIRGLEMLNVVPGRFQRVDRGQDFLVLVDYAHTDDALNNILKSARQITPGKIIVVFGAGGDRDRGKRPLMGEVAAKLSDYIIVTSDNPRSEDPALIALDIEIGIKRVISSPGQYEIILNREAAIQAALKIAGTGDTVIIAGKGHEAYEIFADRTIHFDDVEIAGKYLDQMQGYKK